MPILIKNRENPNGRCRCRITPQVTTQVRPKVKRLLEIMDGDMTRQDIQVRIVLNNREHLRKTYLQPALQKNLIEMIFPDNHQSSKQKYRITQKGQLLLEIINS